ncbi:DUF3606 domain-containing protein [Mesorhizobium sp. M0306]|uniref:DUF3606 domain-containing protein n=1 Tax=unclassified Mesorhizobium TaxID=325217 RepID=UPI00333AA628
MADDHSKLDVRDRTHLSAHEVHEVEYFAEQNGLTPDQVRQLVRTHGNDRTR